ncbi:hypothetical protein AVEN_245484-1 [Araneus ventricosus]|uniref:Uncharacterized protein n=1 Tax=Araneus ventricosus TaxID=182803 RepID=A0A4Y2D7J2_ARAVE|nr:hypothetical protein AVEN_245484-1 [Araneus ventricosus]
MRCVSTRLLRVFYSLQLLNSNLKKLHMVIQGIPHPAYFESSTLCSLQISASSCLLRVFYTVVSNFTRRNWKLLFEIYLIPPYPNLLLIISAKFYLKKLKMIVLGVPHPACFESSTHLNL